jgi:MFS family permease
VTADLRANWRPFALLVVVNGFVGAMVGVERAVAPLLGEREFGVQSHAALLAFIASFGVVKALANLAAGALADRVGRRRLLLLGWLIGMPVPVILHFATSWDHVVLANVFLGVQQGLCWSTAVVMKIDLAGPKQRGLAMGLNEFAGYGAVALAALLAGQIGATLGLREALVQLGAAFAILGFALSLFVRDTSSLVRAEGGEAPPFAAAFARSSWQDRRLVAVNQAGLVNNLNDGMAWGLLPLLFAGAGLGVSRIAALTALYPAAWGVAQLVFGPLSDRWGRRGLVAAGMLVQAAALALYAVGGERSWATAGIALGLGTAMVYPTLLAAVGDAVEPAWRAPAVGVYRLWRDLGYAVGALLSGFVADALGVGVAIGLVAGLTALSGAFAWTGMAAPAREQSHQTKQSA